MSINPIFNTPSTVTHLNLDNITGTKMQNLPFSFQGLTVLNYISLVKENVYQKLNLFYHILLQNLGVPVEGQVRVQFNLKVERSPNIYSVAKFPDIVFPIIWLQEVNFNCNNMRIYAEW